MADVENSTATEEKSPEKEDNPFQQRLRRGVQELLKACDLTTTSIKQLRLGLEHHLGYKAGSLDYLKDLVCKIIHEEVVAQTDHDGLPVPYGDTEYRGALEHERFPSGNAGLHLFIKKKVAYNSDEGKGEWTGLLTLEKDATNCKIELVKVPRSTICKIFISNSTCSMEGTVVKGNGHLAGKVTYDGVDGGRFSLYPIDPRPPEDNRPPKPEKDPNAPKKPAGGGYGIFQNERREDVRKQIIEETGKKVGFGPVAKVLSEQWKALSEMQKGDYQQKYQDAVVKYEADLKAYEKKKLADEKKAKAQKAREEKKAAYRAEMNEKRAALGLPPLKERVVKRQRTDQSDPGKSATQIQAEEQLEAERQKQQEEEKQREAEKARQEAEVAKLKAKKGSLTEEEKQQLKEEVKAQKRAKEKAATRAKFGEYLSAEVVGPEVESPQKKSKFDID